MRGYCGIQKFNKVIMSYVIPEVEEANAVLRRPYSWTIRLERQAMATSMAHYQKMPHCRGRASKRELTLA